MQYCGLMSEANDHYWHLVCQWRERYSREAAEALYTQVVPLVKTYYNSNYYSRVRQGTLDDLAHEVWLKVFSKLHTYRRDSGAFSTWVCRIARNHFLDHLKKRAPTLESDLTPPPGEKEPTPLAEYTPTRIASGLLSLDEMDTIHGYTPFTIDATGLTMLGDVFIQHQGKTSTRATQEVEDILNAREVRWKHYKASTEEITTYLFGLIRIAKACEGDQEMLGRLLQNYPIVTPVGLLKTFLNPQSVAIIVMLFGGTSVALPRADELLKRRRHR